MYILNNHFNEIEAKEKKRQIKNRITIVTFGGSFNGFKRKVWRLHKIRIVIHFAIANFM